MDSVEVAVAVVGVAAVAVATGELYSLVCRVDRVAAGPAQRVALQGWPMGAGCGRRRLPRRRRLEEEEEQQRQRQHFIRNHTRARRDI